MAALTPTAGSLGFAAFLKANGVADPPAAAALGTNEISVYQWRTGRARPTPPFRSAIRRWTNGEVPEAAWLTDAERECAEHVVPFESAAAGAR